MKKSCNQLFFKIGLFWWLALVVLQSKAQTGNLYVANYNIPLPTLGASNVAAQAGSDGRIYFANTKGVLIYNGATWALARTPATPYALAADSLEESKVYVGGREHFGFLQAGEDGQDVFVPYSTGQKNIGNITQIVLVGEKGYFMSERTVFQVDLEGGKITQTWHAVSPRLFSGMLVAQEQVFVNVLGKGLQLLKGEKLQAIAGTQSLGREQLLAAFPLQKGQTLVATSSNRLFLFDGQKLKSFPIQGQSFLETNVLTGGTDLSPSAFALSTVSGGCLIVDKQTGKTQHVVNFQTGLPDDEVLALGSDKQGGVWICHAMGISRADTQLPVRNYSSFPGLVGNVTQVVNLNNLLYVATGEGIFYLDKVDNFEEVSGFVKQKRQIQQLTKTIKITESRKGLDLGFLNPLFGSKQDRKVETSEQVDVISVEDNQGPSRSQKEIYALQSIPYIFKRVEGFSGKSKQLTVYNGQVFAASSNGFFRISGGSAQPLIGNQYVNFVYPAVAPIRNRLYIATNSGLFSVVGQGANWQTENYASQIKNSISYICQEGQNLWLGIENQVVKAQLTSNGAVTSIKRYSIDNQYAESIPVFNIKGSPAFFLSTGIHRYDQEKDQLVADEDLTKELPTDVLPVYSQNNLNWALVDQRWQELSGTEKLSRTTVGFLNLFSSIGHVSVDDQQNFWVADENNQVYKIDTKNYHSSDAPLTVYLNTVTDKEGHRLPLDDISVEYDHNALNFSISTRHYGPESAIQYQFLIGGIGSEWSAWSSQPTLKFPVLPDGSYTLSVRARDAIGKISDESEFDFYVQPPFWKSWWFQLIILAGIGAGVYAFIKYRTQRLEEANRILEIKVQERTAEIVKQKDQIELQKNDIELQKQALEVAYTDISKKNKHITSSINYAQKIQHAILPVHQQMQEGIPDVFVLFKPRDVVSGDFYWFSQKGDVLIIAAVDCTGHGVPGAFMSMIGNTLLNQIVNEKNITEPAAILNHLHQGVRKALKQESEQSERQDGMDIALCSINKRTRVVQYAGANNPLIWIQNGQLEEIKGNKFSIGGMQKEAERSFTNHTLQLTDTTQFYLFSDGYEDQFGGPENKRFMSKRFKQLLLEVHQKPAGEQKQVLEQTIEQWQGRESQMDDMLVVGFRISVGVEAGTGLPLPRVETQDQLS
jgi:serine phosphatase RsbU (regulator of sigma subunit)/ligand-binding sensor domain-containing protein